MQSRDNRLLLRDLLLLLVLPALCLGGLLVWWRPWYHKRFAVDRFTEAEDSARARGTYMLPWRGFHLTAPEDFVLMPNGQGVEFIEEYPGKSSNETWAARLALFPMDSASEAHWREQLTNCDLAPGRCWTDSIAGVQADCLRPSGVPDPAIWWTPHISCRLPSLGIRYLINASGDKLPDVQDALDTILRSRIQADSTASAT